MNTEPRYRVLVNAKGQHSLWPQHKNAPSGWSEAGLAGTREECLAGVRQVWTDMRPVHLRA